MANVVVSSTKIFREAGCQHWRLCIPRELENHVNVSPISSWDVNEPLRKTSVCCWCLHQSKASMSLLELEEDAMLLVSPSV